MWYFQLLKGFGAGSSPTPPDPADTFSHSPADIVEMMLRDLGLTGDGTSWPSSVNSELADDDDVVTVYDTPGRSEGAFQVDGQCQQQDGVQIRVRSSSHKVNGWLKADTIAKTLDQSVTNRVVTIDGSSYIVYDMARTGPVISLGKDSPTSKRNIYTVNYLVAVRPLEA